MLLTPREKGLGCKFAVLGLTFLSLEKQYLINWVLL